MHGHAIVDRASKCEPSLEVLTRVVQIGLGAGEECGGAARPTIAWCFCGPTSPTRCTVT
jgi:hypothetical protein